MVSLGSGHKRDAPEYSLDAVRRLAEFRQVEYRGRKVQRDVASLGFDLDDVCDCLQMLQGHHFAHSVHYENFPRWHDVYRIRNRSGDGRTFELYIKLRLSNDCVVLELCSFHD